MPDTRTHGRHGSTHDPEALIRSSRTARHAGACLLLCAVSVGCFAQTTAYRCDIGGRTVYQSLPCTAGSRIDVNDHRSDAQSAAQQADTHRLTQFADRTGATNRQLEKVQEAWALKQMAAARAAMPKAVAARAPKTPKPKRIKIKVLASKSGSTASR